MNILGVMLHAQVYHLFCVGWFGLVLVSFFVRCVANRLMNKYYTAEYNASLSMDIRIVYVRCNCILCAQTQRHKNPIAATVHQCFPKEFVARDGKQQRRNRASSEPHVGLVWLKAVMRCGERNQFCKSTANHIATLITFSPITMYWILKKTNATTGPHLGHVWASPDHAVSALALALKSSSPCEQRRR